LSRAWAPSKSSGTTNLYDTIFAEEFPDTKFLSAGNAADVMNDRLAFVTALPKIASGITVKRLTDGDDHTSADVQQFNAKGIRVLSRSGRRYLCCSAPIITADRAKAMTK
jgi:hypothetical protein